MLACGPDCRVANFCGRGFLPVADWHGEGRDGENWHSEDRHTEDLRDENLGDEDVDHEDLRDEDLANKAQPRGRISMMFAERRRPLFGNALKGGGP